MKIGLVTEYFPKTEKVEITGGVEARIFYVGKNLAERNDVTVYTSLGEGESEEEEISGMTVRRVRPNVAYSQSSALLKRLMFMKNARERIRREEFDVVDGCSFISYPVAWNSIAKRKIATYHDVWLGEWMRNLGVKGLLGEVLERYALDKKWDQFIAVSEYTKGKLMKAGVNAGRITVVHNGVEYERLGKIRAEKSNQPTICTVSRLVGYKRIDELILALPIVKEKIPAARLRIVGGGPEEGKLKNLVKKLGLSGDVEFLGFVREHDKVLETIKSSHAFCLPSTVEGFGISIIEAMALHVPYVASNIPAIVEATHNGAGGLLHTPGDIQDLSEKLTHALRGDVQANADFVQKEYDWKILAEKVEETYKKLL